MRNSRSLALGLALLLWSGVSASAQVQPWPGEDWQQSTVLTQLDPAFRGNLSGAHWNPDTRTLWVVCNGPARLWALEEDGQGSFQVAQRGGARAEFNVSGDTEGITQADLSEEVVYVVDEDDKAIFAYDVSTGGAPRRLNRWLIGGHLPLFSGGKGPEGIAFVPDSWLRAKGFVDSAGAARVSRHGMGGLMFVGHQQGGHLYVFDLNRATGAFDFVGRYETAYDETSGLEFDRSTGELSIWHNTSGNVIEITDLTSVARGSGLRKLNVKRLLASPKGGNLEGIAFTPDSSGEGWWWFTDDSNQDGAALMWFQQFPASGLGPSSLTASLGPASPGDGAATPQAVDLAVLQLRLTAGPGDVLLTTLRVHAAGTGDDALDVRSVDLWRDVDGDGARSAPDQRVGLFTVFSGDDGVAEFSGLSETIAANAQNDYLVTLSLAAPAGVSFSISCDPQADLVALDALGQALPASGPPLVGGAQRTASASPNSSTSPSTSTSTTAPGATAAPAPQQGGSRGSSGCSLPSGSAPGSPACLLLLACLLAMARRGAAGSALGVAEDAPELGLELLLARAVAGDLAPNVAR
jgi:hypothetical protein